MAAPLEVPEQDKTEGDTDVSRRNADPPEQETTSSFLPAIAQTSEYVQLAKAGGHKGTATKFLPIENHLRGCVRCYIADLLTHHPFVRDKDTKPVPYSRVDWWDHPAGVDVVVGKR